MRRRCGRCVLWSTLVLLASMSPLTAEVFSPSVRKVTGYSDVELQASNVLYFGALSLLHLCTGLAVKHAGVVYGAVLGSCVHSCASLLLFVDPRSAVGFEALRVLQAVGSSFCSVSGFAAVRTFFAEDVRGSLSFVNTCRAIFLVVGPMASELAVTHSANWRGSFLVLFCISALCLGFSVWTCAVLRPDSSPRGAAGEAVAVPRSEDPDSSERDGPCNSQRARALLLMGGDALGFAALIVWVAQAPFLAPVDHFGVVYGLTFVGSALGPCWTRRLGKTYAGSASLLATLAGWIGSATPSNRPALFAGMTAFNFFRSFASTVAQGELLLLGLGGTGAHGRKNAGQLSGALHSLRMACSSVVLVGAIWLPAWACLGLCNVASTACLLVALRPAAAPAHAQPEVPAPA